MDTNNDKNGIIKSKKLKSINIKSFRDTELNDSIFFLNLLASIHHEWVNYDLIYYIPPKTSSQKYNFNNDQYKKKRIANSRYCITIIRKLGSELFVSPHDLCINEPKAMLSVLASIMTLTAKHIDDDELTHTANNDKNQLK